MMPKRCEPPVDALGGAVPPARHRRGWGGAGGLLLGLTLLAGCATAPATRVSLAGLPPEQVERAARNLPVFNAAWDLVNRKHFDPKYQGVDWQEAGAKFGAEAAAAPDETTFYERLNAMVGLLRDSHTHALTPAQAEERRTQRRARTGFDLVRLEGHWVVSDVLPGSPAAAAGVKRGWMVASRNGRQLGPRVDFRPREGEDATWEFFDENNQAVSVVLRAKQLTIAAPQNRRELEGGFVYLRFDEFGRTARRWLSDELKSHRNATGVILDLRRNPGGETFSLSITVGEFFDRSVNCGTFVTRGGSRSDMNSWQLGSARYRGRVIVLVDAGTGSAAEIFAAVLQDHGRATIVGRKTAGAVLASRFYRLPDGGELQLSREDYFAPNGRRIEGQGIKPDVVVPRTLDDVRRGIDTDLEVALRLLRTPEAEPAAR